MSTMNAQSWVPLRWPDSWKTEQPLALLEGSPINCVLDAPQSIAAGAKTRGLTVLTKEEAAKSMTFLADPVWPHVKMARRGEGADSGPTGAPWVDANGWAIQLARAMSPDKPVWVDAVPPADTVLDETAYALAVAEPAMYGGRWVISLDGGLASKLSAGDAAAAKAWSGLVNTVRFFEEHRDWSAFQACSQLAVVSDFVGDNEFMAREFLNLASRRNLGYRIQLRDRVTAADIAAVKAVLYVDEQPPSKDLERSLSDFVQGGGILIARKMAPFHTWKGASRAAPIPGYEITTMGKGRLAVPSSPWEDPWVLTQEVGMLISRRLDSIRLFNAGIMGAYYTRSHDGAKAVLHLLNYTRRRAAEEVAVAPADKFATARAISPELPQPKMLNVERRPVGFNEIAIPPFRVYAAIEMAR